MHREQRRHAEHIGERLSRAPLPGWRGVLSRRRQVAHKSHHANEIAVAFCRFETCVQSRNGRFGN